MKIKINLNDDLPHSRSKKTLDLHKIVLVVGSDFYGGNKYYLQILSDSCLYQLDRSGMIVGV